MNKAIKLAIEKMKVKRFPLAPYFQTAIETAIYGGYNRLSKNNGLPNNMPKDYLNSEVLRNLRMKVEDLADEKSQFLHKHGITNSPILFELHEILNLIDQSDN